MSSPNLAEALEVGVDGQDGLEKGLLGEGGGQRLNAALGGGEEGGMGAHDVGRRRMVEAGELRRGERKREGKVVEGGGEESSEGGGCSLRGLGGG